MPRGGARVNSGPTPDPDALRRDRQSDKDGWTDLPSEGRSGRAPRWPLVAPNDLVASEYAALTDGGDLAQREAKIWRDAWKTPQAVAWERLGWTLEVALYVRLSVVAEQGDVKAMAELRQWSDRLGLSPAAMLRNRWRIARNQLADRRAVAPKPAAPVGGSLRDRLKAVDGEGA